MKASILDSAPDAVLTIDAEGRVAGVNRTAETLFDRPADDLLGLRLDELVDMPRARFARGVRHPAATAMPAPSARLETFALRGDGRRVPVELRMTGGDSGSPAWTAWIRDLRDRPPAHTESLRRHALLQRAEQIAQIGSWQWNPETGELLWSDQLYRLFGYEPGSVTPSIELIKRHVLPADHDRFEREVDRLGREYTLPPLEYRIARRDGSVRHLRATMAVVVESSPGGTRVIVGSVQDLTEQRRAEREIGAHVAVSGALAEWRSFERGAVRLLRDVAGAMDFAAGVLWVPANDALVARVLWHEPALAIRRFEAATRATRFARGVGLPGKAWERLAPINLVRVHPDAGYDRRLPAAADVGLRGALAVPALHANEVLAVLEFYSREEAELTSRLMRSLTGIGYELGQFFARRRGELRSRALTPRELEVLQLAAQGHSGRRIAEKLVLSPATVKTHFEHIYDKLGVSDRASAVAEALRLGLIH